MSGFLFRDIMRKTNGQKANKINVNPYTQIKEKIQPTPKDRHQVELENIPILYCDKLWLQSTFYSLYTLLYSSQKLVELEQ